MALIRYSPFREIDTLQREMNRLFDTISSSPETENSGLTFIPPAEISETSDAIHLKLEIPGMDPEHFDVQVTAESVSISGERRSQTITEQQGMTRSEFRYGQFRRVIPLPARVKNTEVQAEYKNGILQLNLPKAEEEKNKVVKVNIG
ncbi:Hsp20/alpha crystallin family protein [Laspinema palackyanum]|uniref:Hsp20/alpha crystallin family protein n=1 Tax=Laspinema palackyanum TaxID=3231601 RepID=UPI00345DF046|nr:Hsp20/alpha crystallin family protein [Laspinema sp. D2c]